MATHKMFFSGFGGQGVMLVGQMVASAAILDNKTTTFFPSYGPEMRGGTANCTVIVSDKPISSPLIFESDCVLAMNLPSMLKFESSLKPGGVLLLNSSLIHQKTKRDDVTVFEVPVNDMAAEIGNPLVANMIMFGAFVRTTGIVTQESAEQVIRNVFGAKKAELVDLELKAFNYWKE